MKHWNRLPWVILAVFALWFAGSLVPRRDNAMASQAFGRLPILFNGRLQPMDSLARNSLLQIRGKQSANIEPWKDSMDKPRILSASEWLMGVMAKPEESDGWKIFRVDHPDLKGLLGLAMEADPAKQEDGKHYSWRQVASDKNFQAIEQNARTAREKDAAVRSTFDNAVLKLHNAMTLVFRLKNTLQPQDSADFAADLAAAGAHLPAEVGARAQLGKAVEAYQLLRQQQRQRRDDVGDSVRRRVTEEFQKLLAMDAATRDGGKLDRETLLKLMPFIDRMTVLEDLEPPLVIPPHKPGSASDLWMRTGATVLEHLGGEPLPETAKLYWALTQAYRKGDAGAVSRSVEGLHGQMAALGLSRDVAKVRREQFFNQMAPFYRTMVLYVVAFLLALSFWFNFAEWSRRSAFLLIGFAFLVHTAGLIFRMSLEGRPPVTNLYSSAVFIGWGSVGLGMILERFWRNAIGLVVASALGFITLIVAHNLSLDGDTLQMMQAVLDTNFWLATHVVIVTLGYASTFVAGFLAIIYVLRGVFTRGLDAATGRSLTRMIYGIVCFATLFSFVGTVLGGIWADQSWGRFWGWDPKENGALIIVLWNALILHARWGGLVRERGLANLAIGGNIVTAWSWFGTNMLGIGLHSYGFTDGAFLWLSAFILSQLVLIILGALPQTAWKSAAALAAKPARA